MKTIIKAVADPSSLRKLPRDIQTAVRSAKIQVKIEAQKTQARKDLPAFAKGLGKVLPAIQIQTKASLSQARKEKSKAGAIFKKAINQPIHIGPVNPNAVSVGLQISTGIAAGVYAGAPFINSAVASVVNAGIAAGRGAAKAKSPSKKTRDEIGIPLAQGIAVGVMSQMGLIEKTARLAIDFFNGPWLTSPKFTDSKKKVKVHVRDIIKDLQMQTQQFHNFNQSLATLARRGVPLAMLDQLSQLGAEGTKNITKLANATQKQLNRYVAIWKSAMREIQRSNRSSFETIVADLHSFVDQAAQTMLDKWNEFHDNLKGAWDDLFKGFDDKIGEGFKSALESWQSGLDDLRKQLADTYDQIKDVQKQMRDHISDEFGKLFEGAVIASEHVQNKLNWGAALNMDDLTKDLQAQLAAFTKWRGNLASLVGKIPPELLSQLAELGPGAAAEIAALAGASKPELDNYVAIWQQSQDAINNATKDAIPDKAEFQAQITTLVGQVNDLMKQINDILSKKPKALTPADLLAGIGQQLTDLLTSNKLIDQLRKKGVPAEVLAQLAGMGAEALPYLVALNNMTATQLKQYVGIWNTMQKAIDAETKKMMDAQIKQCKKHGADIAAGIIAGVMSEQEALLKFFRNLFLKLLKEARKETKSHSPSQVFASLGEDLVLGLALGLNKGKGMKVPIPSLANPVLGTGRGNSLAPVNMTIHAHQDESLMSTMQRAAFRLRNRKV
jgi:hypothetical protein